MAEPKLIHLPGERQQDIQYVLNEALKDSKDFEGVFIAALVDVGAGEQAVRIYYSGLNRLERCGILNEAADLVRNPEE
jgi:hypothetical protein